jgi:glyoxylate/hydroxypyruvate reductase A
MSETAAPILLVRSGGEKALPQWQEAFGAEGAPVEVRWWNDPTVDPDRVHFVLVWEPEPGRLAGYPNLKVIFSSAAGVDHITRDPHLPRHIPIVSMGADEVAQTVGEYICLAALMILRDAPRMLAAQREAKWDAFEVGRTACATRVGIMGMGRIGALTARMLQGLGFPVHGWTRTKRQGGDIRSYAGPDELAAFLGQSDILVSILPDTPQTSGLINATTLAMLPPGAGVINAGRGTLIVMPDLLAALDSGHLTLAVLDVFDPEPLPPTNPAWHHPRVVVTPHIAGRASPRSRAQAVSRGLAQYAAGLPLEKAYDPERGY